jgi:small subunit ribosomal protein S8
MIQSRPCDFLIRLKNAYLASQKSMTAPSSSFCVSMAALLKKHHLVEDFVVSEGPLKTVTLTLSYQNHYPRISHVKLFSKPGRRSYCTSSSLPWGSTKDAIFIISTSRGLMTQKEARSEKIGGELVAELY